MAVEDNTDVFLNGVFVITLNAGQFHQYADNAFTLITSTKPVAVMQYAEGVACGGPGDPFQVLLYPIEQSLESITFNAFQTPLVNQFWVNILVQTVNVPNVTLDGGNISASFLPFPSDPTYSYARINIAQGDHTLVTPGGSLATVYGWGNAESFGYCAGASLKNLTNDFSILNTPTCTNDIINFAAIPDPSTIGFSWDFGDGSPVQTGINTSHSYAAPGTYEVTLSKEKLNACDVQIIKPLDIFELPINITQADTSVCAGTILDLNIPVSDTFIVERINACGDISYNTIYIQYDSIYWSTGQVGRNIQITPTSDTMIYAYGEQYGSSCRAIDSVFIQVIDLQADFTFSDVCQTDSICLVNQSISNAPYNNTRYSIDNVLLVANDLDYCFLNNVPGVYDIELYVETNIGCRDSITESVEVFPNPTAEFDCTNACDNEDVLFESTALPGIGTISNYLWDIDDNVTNDYSVDVFGHIYGQDGLYTVEHIVNNSYGCSDTISKQITVYALPNAAFTVDAVCEDTTTTFANASAITPVDGDVISNYAWTFGVGASSGIENPNHNYNNENIYTAQLVITTNYGCKDSISHPVNVYPLPAPDFTPTSVCLEDDSEFMDLTTVSNSHTTNSVIQWNWDFGDGTTSTQQNPSNEYAADGTYTATLEVVTNHGCRYDITKTVTDHPLTVVSFSGINLEGCSPVCPQISSTSTINSPSTISNYDWTLSDGRTYQGSAISDCYNNTSGNSVFYNLNLVVTSNEGCVSSHTENNYIEIYHNPTANFYFEPGESSVIDNEVEFFNTSVYADYYAWTFGNEGTSSQTNPIFTFTPEPQKHEITLVATTTQGCTDTARAVVDILDKIIFYVPNTFTPDNDKFNESFRPVFTSGFDPQDYTLLIFNRWGETIFESHDTNIGWDGRYGIESRKIIKEGTYIWKIEFKETMSDKRHTHTGHVNLLK